MLAETVGKLDIIVVLIYLLMVGYLGYLGYRGTKTTSDYLVAGRKTHPFIMALSYGATFISTSAIVGFGGVAGLFGMSVLWLTVFNIFVGIFVAFVIIGGPARRMGHLLDAHTFPELLGRRYQSKFIQVLAGLIIFIFIPLYAAAVLIGGTEFITTQFNMDYTVALMILSIIVAAYVIMGGLKGVMYTDALQGCIMFVGMIILLVYSYYKVGGVVEGHQTLTNLTDLVPGKLREMGHRGFTAMPEFGFGDKKYDLWWTVISTITLGVGIGVLAQPQLIVRFMTVKSKRELNRAVLIGGIFILFMTGVAFTVGSLSNAYFSQHGKEFSGRVVKDIDPAKHHAVLQIMKKDDAGKWADVFKKDEKGNEVPAVVPVVLSEGEPDGQAAITQDGNPLTVPVVKGRSIAIVYAQGNAGQIIPTFITSALPKWFGLVFLLTLLAAAMSTMSSQFHTLGTSFGRDVFENITKSSGHSIAITRFGIIVGIVIAVWISYSWRQSTFIARATAIFFGLCASAFLPAFVGGLFSKKVTKAGAIASMIVGFLVTAFWLLFVKAQEAGDIGLVKLVTGGKTSILDGHYNWPSVDPIVIALPISFIVLIVVSAITKPLPQEHVSFCFKK